MLHQPIPVEEMLGNMAKEDVLGFCRIEPVDQIQPSGQNNSLRRGLIQREADHNKIRFRRLGIVGVWLHHGSGQEKSVAFLAGIEVGGDGNLTADDRLDALASEAPGAAIQRGEEEEDEQEEQEVRVPQRGGYDGGGGGRQGGYGRK